MSCPRFLLAAALVLGQLESSRAESPRTDINPALLYWQAQAAMPVLSDADHRHAFTEEWRGRELDESLGAILARYDPSFRLLRVAAQQRVPCEWGYDLSEGPDLELPSLAKAKSLAQTARLRLRWLLEQRTRDAARDDFLATFVLARQVSKDGILISALVQFAMENILTGAIAENWHRLDTGTLEEMVAGMEASPVRGTVAQCIAGERIAFQGWLIRNIEEARALSSSESEVLRIVKGALSRLSSDDPTLADRIVAAAGGTSEGLLRYIHQVDPLYAQADELMQRPYHEFRSNIKTFNDLVAGHPNLLVHVFFPIFEKCRLKEFAVDVKSTLVRAAVEYRKQGPAGLERVLDPVGGKPFEFRRFVFEGVDRGFELRSSMDSQGWVEALIFVETEGRPFRIEGKNVGRPME